VGEWVFVMTDEAKLLCVARSSGKVRWISKLQRFKNEKKKKGPISWYGPVLAGGRLIVANSHGAIWSISPEEGAATEVFDVKNDVSLAPIVANNTLYILDDSGRISAFRG
jgi:outer membrane protein assembly factor BamB